MSDVFNLEFLKWKKSAYDLCYRSGYSVSECIRRIMEQPWTYSDSMFLADLWYQCEQTAVDSLRITFTGGQARKAVRTAYFAKFIQEPEGTLIILNYETELMDGFLNKVFHVQIPPMTTTRDIDQFMREKVSAERILG